jgi:hypothetical protein
MLQARGSPRVWCTTLCHFKSARRPGWGHHEQSRRWRNFWVLWQNTYQPMSYGLSESERDFESTNMIRLKELMSRQAVLRHQQNAGKQTWIINQYNTGTVSRYILVDILKEKYVQLCMCPMCNENDLAN